MRKTVSLKKNYDFRRLYAKGVCKADAFLAVYCRRTSRPGNRLGITVGKKVGKAVVRNRLRRRIREIYRLREDRMETGWDIVVVCRGRAAEADYRRLEKSLVRLLEKQGVLTGGGESREKGHAVADPVLPETHLPG